MTRYEIAPEKKLVIMDTHVWIWLSFGDKTLGPKASDLIIKASESSSLLLSSISLWEVAMLESKGRLSLSRDIHTWMQEALSIPGLSVEPITPVIAIDSTRLPEGFHADPSDRIIVATARHKDAILITRDSEILEYGRHEHLKCMEA
jgi:PIN domain nuclease of toxin-antitoxin system